MTASTNNRFKILLVEDEGNIRNLVTAILESADYQVLHASRCGMAITMFRSHIPDLVILDLGLPDQDGLVFLRDIREDSLVPVIVLSARSDERDKVLALDAGANDYITKPFGSAELLARIRTALRVCRQSEVGRLPGGTFTLGDLQIDYDARLVYLNGEVVRLTQTEYNIVAYLSEHCGKMMTYAAIVKAVWGYPDEGSIKRLQVNMANIRKKFGAKPGEPRYIINELGVGYRMSGD